jgi:hypothetical protein
MNKAIINLCMAKLFEKQIVFRVKRLSRVLNVKISELRRTAHCFAQYAVFLS